MVNDIGTNVCLYFFSLSLFLQGPWKILLDCPSLKFDMTLQSNIDTDTLSSIDWHPLPAVSQYNRAEAMIYWDLDKACILESEDDHLENIDTDTLPSVDWHPSLRYRSILGTVRGGYAQYQILDILES